MLRIVFAATPALACHTLDALYRLQKQGRIQICGLLTQADRPAGRRRRLQPSPIKARARELGFGEQDIWTPERLDSALRCQVADQRPSLLVVFAYGKIFGPKFLNLFSLGGINLHPSALPQWRGPCPIEAQLLSGARQLGISVQRISLEMDAGDVLEQQNFPLQADADYFTAVALASEQGAAMLSRSCENIAEEGLICLERARPQQHDRATYCQLLRKEDGHIDWQREALHISRQCRAYAAWPKACTWLSKLSKDSAATVGNKTEGAARQLAILKAGVWQPTAEERRLLGHYLAAARLVPARPGQLLTWHPGAGLLVLCGSNADALDILAVQRLQLQSRNPCSAKEFVNQLQGGLPKWSQLESCIGQPSAPDDSTYYQFVNAALEKITGI